MKETHVILNGHHQMYLALHCCSFGTGVHLYNNLHCILCILLLQQASNLPEKN